MDLAQLDKDKKRTFFLFSACLTTGSVIFFMLKGLKFESILDQLLQLLTSIY